MNRHYDIDKVVEIVKEIKGLNPKIEISTQFIYGFPTETFEEFKDYFKMLSVFDEIWFWYYSERKGTKSVDIYPKIPKEEMIRRLKFLWKFKERFLTKIFDKNEVLEQGIAILKQRIY
jgi:tRNA-2-methylthio-N6-dimethylallyladenosine synthase